MKGSRWLIGLLLLCGFLTAARGTADVIEERRALMRALADNIQGIWNELARGGRACGGKQGKADGGTGRPRPSTLPAQQFSPTQSSAASHPRGVSDFRRLR